MSYHNIIIKYQNNIVEELILFTHQYTMSCRIVSYSQMNLFVSDQVEKFSQVLQPALSMFFYKNEILLEIIRFFFYSIIM